MFLYAIIMNRFHKTLGVLHIVELAPWLCMVCRRSFAAKANLLAIETGYCTANQKTAKC